MAASFILNPIGPSRPLACCSECPLLLQCDQKIGHREKPVCADMIVLFNTLWCFRLDDGKDSSYYPCGYSPACAREKAYTEPDHNQFDVKFGRHIDLPRTYYSAPRSSQPFSCALTGGNVLIARGDKLVAFLYFRYSVCRYLYRIRVTGFYSGLDCIP